MSSSSSAAVVAAKEAIAVYALEGTSSLGHPRGRLFFDETAALEYALAQLRGEVVFRAALNPPRSVGVKADTVAFKLASAYPCTICGAPVEARIWEGGEIDYCAGCYYGGGHHARRLAGLLGEIEGASVWHTGGGCFALVVGTAPLIAATDGEAGVPDTEDGPWLVCEYADEDAWMSGEPVREAEGVDRAGLLEFVRAAQ